MGMFIKLIQVLKKHSFGYKPKVNIKKGIKKFTDWYFNYFN